MLVDLIKSFELKALKKATETTGGLLKLSVYSIGTHRGSATRLRRFKILPYGRNHVK